MRVAFARLSLPSIMLALAACNGSVAASDPSLTLNGSAGAPRLRWRLHSASFESGPLSMRLLWSRPVIRRRSASACTPST
jgi:hypothetical protein